MELNAEKLIKNRTKLLENIKSILSDLDNNDKYSDLDSNSKVNGKIWIKNLLGKIKDKVIYIWAEFYHSIENMQHPFIEIGINLKKDDYEKEKENFSNFIEKMYQEKFYNIEKLLSSPNRFFNN